MRNIIAIILVVMLSSCGILRKSISHKHEREKIDSVVVKSDTTDIVIKGSEQQTDTSKTTTSEEGEYVIIYGKYDMGDTIIIAPQKIIGKYNKKSKTQEGQSKTTDTSTIINTGSKDSTILNKDTNKKEIKKETKRIQLGIIPIGIIVLLLYLLYKIFPPLFVKNQFLILINKLKKLC
jgi:hypothetical protein